MAGNVSSATSFTFTLDTAAPAAPGVALTTDSGSSGTDHITNTGALTLSGIETGALVQYSINNGQTWTSSFTAVEGLNTVQVRQTDVAGNVSSATSFSFTLDTTAPTAPGVALATDSGSSGTDHITNTGALTLSGIETGAIVQYSVNNGQTWTNSFTAVEGLNTVAVRQTDVAGNVSSATSFSFTLSTAGPTAPGVALATDSGSSGTDHITNSGALTLSGIETGATRSVLDQQRPDLDQLVHRGRRRQHRSGSPDRRGRQCVHGHQLQLHAGHNGADGARRRAGDRQRQLRDRPHHQYRCADPLRHRDRRARSVLGQQRPDLDQLVHSG